jgi:hypothetical protein
LLPNENGGKKLRLFGKGTELMRKLAKITFMAIAFGFLVSSADDAMAQGRNREARREYRNEVREARREYRDDIRDGDSRRSARREYRNEVREARREYRQDRRDNRGYNQNYRIYTRPPYGRANGYYNNRVYRNNGYYNRRSTNRNNSRYYYYNGRIYRRY